ncbi:MAG: selenide, water dikinase SelD [Eubacteriales bacterium]|nr:selenide, water dikinase SelD [Eubacteriales bacterium]MDD4389917.1 selenide, water dikinase SelD [Eubacteriales bacterium]
MAPDALSQVLCHLPRFHDPDLLVGFDTGDDASVYRISDDLALIQTVDIFPPVVDDPYEYGLIAAANALSDIYAMNGTPRLAMNILCLPEDLPKKYVKAILAGGYEKVKEADAIITGGHSINDKEPKYGLSVSGFAHPSEIIKNCGSKPGDILILTKALGTGILTTAVKADLITPTSYRSMIDSMARLNKRSSEMIKRFCSNESSSRASCFPNACTDITGFGLAGHAFEMANASSVMITLLTDRFPILPEAEEMAEIGIVPKGAYTNRGWLADVCRILPSASVAKADIAFDPQTSGGLLISMPEKEGMKLLSLLKSETPVAELVGYTEECKADCSIILK